MRTYGISNLYQVSTIGEFCFTIPEGKIGKIDARMIVHDKDHNFLLLTKDDWEKLYKKYNGNIPQLGNALCKGEGSILRTVLAPISNTKFTSYDIGMELDSVYNDRLIYAVLANCKNPINAEYMLQFTNPRKYLSGHFGCQDQGLIQSYSILCFIYISILWFIVRKAYAKLKDIDVPMINCLMLVICLKGISIFGFIFNLLIYAKDGLGLFTSVFLSDLFEAITMIFYSVITVLVFEHYTQINNYFKSFKRSSKIVFMLVCICSVYALILKQIVHVDNSILKTNKTFDFRSIGLSPYALIFYTKQGMYYIICKAVIATIFLKNTYFNLKKAQSNEVLDYKEIEFLSQLLKIYSVVMFTPLMLKLFLNDHESIKIIILNLTELYLIIFYYQNFEFLINVGNRNFSVQEPKTRKKVSIYSEFDKL